MPKGVRQLRQRGSLAGQVPYAGVRRAPLLGLTEHLEVLPSAARRVVQRRASFRDVSRDCQDLW